MADDSHGSEHRLEIVARHIHNVSRYGVKNNDESDYQLDLAPSPSGGPGRLIAYFGAATGRTEEQ